MKIQKLALPLAAAASTLAVTSAVRANESLSQLGSLSVGIAVTVNPNGSITAVDVGGPYDGIEDTLVTVTNNSNAPLYSLNLTSSNDIFGFDSDGISTYTGQSSADSSGYGSPDSYFVDNGYNIGTVYFGANGISGNGGTDYFSLEEAPSISGGTLVVSGAPDGASTVGLLGAVVLGLGALRRRFAR